MSVDILRPLLDDELLVYAEHCRNHWPKAIRAHHFLKQHYTWQQKFKKLDETQLNEIPDKCRMPFFTPVKSQPEECTFIAISGEKDYSVFYYTLEDPPLQLEAGLRLTKRINWQKQILYVSIQEEHQKLLLDLIKDKDLLLLFNTQSYFYRLKKEIAMGFQFDLPENVKLSKLQEEDAPTIVAEWPHRYPGCDSYVRAMINLNYGLGIFDNRSNELLSMVLRNDNGALGVIQTIDSAKRKGYASVLAKAMSKSLAQEDDDDVLAYVIQENTASNALFQKTGYEIVGNCSWLGSKPKTTEF